MVNPKTGSHGGKRLGSNSNIANTRHLKRILIILKEAEKPLIKTEIQRRMIGLSVGKKLNDALLFLLKNNLIEERNNLNENRRRSNSKLYIINQNNYAERLVKNLK